MEFRISDALLILERTPAVLKTLLGGLDETWTMQNEGPDTWSPFDVIGHLIHGEKTDWMPRLEIILSDGDKRFTPFDRFAQYEASQGKALPQLLTEFAMLRAENLRKLRAIPSLESHFQKTGIHPAFGEITVEQLLSTWVVHDLNHLMQISRVMAKRYQEKVGPWVEYLRILQ